MPTRMANTANPRCRTCFLLTGAAICSAAGVLLVDPEQIALLGSGDTAARPALTAVGVALAALGLGLAINNIVWHAAEAKMSLDDGIPHDRRAGTLGSILIGDERIHAGDGAIALAAAGAAHACSGSGIAGSVLLASALMNALVWRRRRRTRRTPDAWPAIQTIKTVTDTDGSVTTIVGETGDVGNRRGFRLERHGNGPSVAMMAFNTTGKTDRIMQVATYTQEGSIRVYGQPHQVEPDEDLPTIEFHRSAYRYFVDAITEPELVVSDGCTAYRVRLDEASAKAVRRFTGTD